jgi:hypothetical protein
MTKEEFVLTIAKDLYVARGISTNCELMGDHFKKLVDKVKEAYEATKDSQSQ